MTEEPKLEALPHYTFPAPLVEALFNYLGTQAAAQVEGLRAGMFHHMFQQQRAAALAGDGAIGSVAAGAAGEGRKPKKPR